jgi:MoxR-like ATPase
MFNPKVLRVLAEKFSKTFKNLKQVENILNQRFAGMEQTVRALGLAVASGEPMLLIGPPGTGKSQVVLKPGTRRFPSTWNITLGC